MRRVDLFGVSSREREARRWTRIKLRPIVRERLGLWGYGGLAHNTTRADWLNSVRRAHWAGAVIEAAEARQVRTLHQARRLLWQAAVWRIRGEMTMIPDGGSYAAS